VADNISGLTEVAGTIETVVSAEIQMVMNANIVVPGTIMDYSSMVRPGMDTLKIPRMGKFSVVTKAENVAVDAQVNAFSTDSLPLDQHKVVQFLIEDIAELQSKVAVAQEYVKQAGTDLAVQMDLKLLTDMAAGVSTASPDNKRAYAGSAIAKADILLARQLLNEQNVPLNDRSLIVSPAQENALLSIAEFTKVNESGSEVALRNGQMGRIFGFDVFVSSLALDAFSLAFHKSCHAFARQLAPRVKLFDDVPNLATRYSFDHIYGSKHLDSGKRLVVLGTA
jgi:N4-gp56 family major capsid protein